MNVGSFEKLRKLSDEELIQAFDEKSESTNVGLSFLRDELSRREAEKQMREMDRMTTQMLKLTWVIMVLTIINTVAVIVSLMR